VFDDLLEMGPIADQLGLDSAMAVLQALALNSDACRDGCDAHGLKLRLASLLSVPCMEELPPERAYRVLSLLVDSGHSFGAAFASSNLETLLTAEQVMPLMQLALQHGNYGCIRKLSSLPAASELCADDAMPFALLLLRDWQDEPWRVCSKQQVYGQALQAYLKLPWSQQLGAQEFNRLAAVAI
jgi:hypothetical protein